MALNEAKSCCAGESQNEDINAAQIRQSVSDYYAALIERQSCCCSESCCPERPRRTAAENVGYNAEELAEIPDDAAEQSFGCGTPLAYADVKKGDVVLDLGSGAGIDVFLASRMVEAEGKVIGLDMTQKMIDRARKNAAEAGIQNVEFRLGEMEDMPVEDESVDWVISNCVINLSPDKGKVFGEASRVLKAGGRMLVSDIVADGLPESMRKDPTIWSCCIGGAMPEDDYLQAFRDAGLRNVKILSKVVYNPAILEKYSDCCPADSEQSEKTDTKLASITVSATKP